MRRPSFRAALCVTAALTVAGCGALPGNPQGYAGITRADVEVGVLKAGEQPFIKSVVFRDGKEKRNVTLTVGFEDGKPTITYRATGVAAFDGHKLRADLEQAISADVRAVAPAIVDTILDAVKGSLGVPPLP